MAALTVPKFDRRRGLGRIVTLGVLCVTAILALHGTASAATLVRVTQNDPSWTQDDTRGGGTVSWTADYGAPPQLGSSALQLTTTGSNVDKAGLYTHTMAGTPLTAVTDLSYWTYQASASFSGGAASYQLQVDTDGTIGDGVGFTTLVFEPYNGNGTVQNGVWQQWNVDAGQFWSSRSTACGLLSGAGGPPFYTLQQVQMMCPNAVVVGIGVNIGSFNPSYVVATDGVLFNDTAYNFEIGTRPSSADDCKRGGWRRFNDPEFKNQGDCVSYVQTGK